MGNLDPINFAREGITFGSSLRKVTELTRVKVQYVHMSGEILTHWYRAGALRGLLRDGYPEGIETIQVVWFPQVNWRAPSSDREETRKCLLSLLNADLGGE